MLYGNYSLFYEELSLTIPKERLCEKLSKRIAVCEDGSIYRYIPKIVIYVESEAEVALVLKSARQNRIPVIFRGSGSSVAGQSLTNSALVIVSRKWNRCQYLESSQSVVVSSGSSIASINRELSKVGRKISFKSIAPNATIGGVVSDKSFDLFHTDPLRLNNSIISLRAVLFDGTILDTRNATCENDNSERCVNLLRELNTLKRSVAANEPMFRKIKDSNDLRSSGYQINALCHDSNRQMLNTLFIGACGTLGFISEVHLATEPISTPTLYGGVCLEQRDELKHIIATLQDNGLSETIFLQNKSTDLILHNNIDTIKGDINNTLLFKLENSQSPKEDIQKQLSAYGVESFILENTEIIVDCIRLLKQQFIIENGDQTSSVYIDFRFPKGKLFEASDFIHEHITQRGELVQMWSNPLQETLHLHISIRLVKADDLRYFAKFIEKLTKEVFYNYGGVLASNGAVGRLLSSHLNIEWNDEERQLMKRIKHLFDPENLLGCEVIDSDSISLKMRNLISSEDNVSGIVKCLNCGLCEKFVNDGQITIRQRILLLRVINEWYRRGINTKLLKQLVNELSSPVGIDESIQVPTGCPMNTDLTQFTISNEVIKFSNDSKFFIRLRQRAQDLLEKFRN